MRKQVLILNVTRMGDVLQTIPLVCRLEQEWPGVAIDMVVDQRMAATAALVSGLRQVLTYDFGDCLRSRLPVEHDLAAISPSLAVWVRPLRETKYDRVVNLTFTPRSGALAAALGVPDTRGAVATASGFVMLRNSWFTHVVNLHQFRRLNQFNLVDLYTLGGSGPGSFTPVRISVPRPVGEWAQQFFSTARVEGCVVAVQVGASTELKSWRPEYVGRTMAALSRQLEMTFVLIGTTDETHAVNHTVKSYREAGGKAALCDAVGRTNVAQLAGLLKRCHLLMTNDTGPMHMAVGVETPVIDVSVGNVYFRETGPYGPGNWVIQPQIDCAPCVYGQLCSHHACKDQVVCEQVADLAIHCLGKGPFPTRWTGVGVYESGVDEDGLACFRFRAGSRDSVAEWYGMFWRRFWYETWTGLTSAVPCRNAVPDLIEQQEVFERLGLSGSRAIALATQLVQLSCQQVLDTVAIKDTNAELLKEQQRIFTIAMASPAFRPVTVALAQDLYGNAEGSLRQKIECQAKAYRVWGERSCEVRRRLQASIL